VLLTAGDNHGRSLAAYCMSLDKEDDLMPDGTPSMKPDIYGHNSALLRKLPRR